MVRNDYEQQSCNTSIDSNAKPNCWRLSICARSWALTSGIRVRLTHLSATDSWSNTHGINLLQWTNFYYSFQSTYIHVYLGGNMSCRKLTPFLYVQCTDSFPKWVTSSFLDNHVRGFLLQMSHDYNYLIIHESIFNTPTCSYGMIMDNYIFPQSLLN